MSYSRWSDSNWYAFPRAGDVDDLFSQKLALWHCDEEQRPIWSYAELSGADREWLRSQYPCASDDDLDEALYIIAEFQDEMQWKDLTTHFPKLMKTIERDPSPRNVRIVIDVLLDRFRETPSSEEVLDFLFSLPASIWEGWFLRRLEALTVPTVCQNEEHLLELLNMIDRLQDKQRLLAVLRSWADKLPRRIARKKAQRRSPKSPEEVAVAAVLGEPSNGEKMLEGLQELIPRFSSGAS